jgi:CheY-like chemotaxis protein
MKPGPPPPGAEREVGFVVGRVLVIHADPAFTTAVHRSLGEAGYLVVECNDPREALLGVLRGEEYDLVLCDVDGPPAAAIQFHEQIAAMNPPLAARVVFLASADVGVTLPNTRIAKPVGVPELRRWVAEFLSLRTLPPRGRDPVEP